MSKNKLIKKPEFDTITFGISKENILSDLQKIRDLCIEKESYANALRAVQLMANIIGFDHGKDPYQTKKENESKQLSDKIEINLISSGTQQPKVDTDNNIIDITPTSEPEPLKVENKNNPFNFSEDELTLPF